MKRVVWCALLSVLPAMAAAQVADYKVEATGSRSRSPASRA